MASSSVCDLNDNVTTASSLSPKSNKRKISDQISADSPSSPVSEPSPNSESPTKKSKSDESRESKLESPNKFEKMTSKMLELLECPVCTEVVRSAPIYGCKSGHIMCSQCRTKVKSCPICRAPDIDCRNILVEQIALPVLEETQLKCVNHVFGCTQSDLGKKLQAHLIHCVYEQVRCPASHRNACTWQGNLIQAVHHAAQGKCAQVLRFREENLFRSSIGDFNEGETVFKRHVRTHWKPVMLLSQSVVRYFLYLIIYRENNGDWFIYLRSLAHKDLSKNIQYHIKLFQPTSADPSIVSSNTVRKENNAVFSFTGQAHDALVSDGDVVKSGDYLRLNDAQVKTMMNGKTIFEYTISIALRRSENGTDSYVPLHPKPKLDSSSSSAAASDA